MDMFSCLGSSMCLGQSSNVALINNNLVLICRSSSNVHRLHSAYEDMLQRQALERDAYDTMASFLGPSG